MITDGKIRKLYYSQQTVWQYSVIWMTPSSDMLILFPSPINVHIIINVFQSCKTIWDFDLTLFFNSHILLLQGIKSICIKVSVVYLKTENVTLTLKSPNGGQCHSKLLLEIWHQLNFHIIIYLLGSDQSDCVFTSGNIEVHLQMGDERLITLMMEHQVPLKHW